MKLSVLFTREVVTAGPKEPLTVVAQRMQEHHVGAVVIVEKRKPVRLGSPDLLQAAGE